MKLRSRNPDQDLNDMSLVLTGIKNGGNKKQIEYFTNTVLADSYYNNPKTYKSLKNA